MRKKLFAVFASLLLLTGCTVNNRNLSFNPGTYIGTGEGYGGPIDIEVSFDSTRITSVNVIRHNETPAVGQEAMPVIIQEIITANGTGVDAVTGATRTFNAIIDAVNKAADDAQVSNPIKFRKNSEKNRSAQNIQDTWDIVVIGAGGAGLAAAAQAAQDGNTVLVIEKNSFLGGNTVTSGGLYQSVTPYLVWNPDDPDATEGRGYDGNMYPKCKSADGCIETLSTILGWSEKPFDADYYYTHPFVPGDIEEQAKHGVHKEYLSTLQALKKEIRAYLDWADAKMASGIAESQLTLFSTDNLHIFQTYYGGLRPSSNMREWCYGDASLVQQMVTESRKLKPWLMDMGVNFLENQILIVGELWYRANQMPNSTVTINGRETTIEGNRGAYVMAPYSTIINADSHNRVMTMTTAKDLIVENGRVVGVNAVCQDGTNVAAHASKGVIIATGGYAANISKVLETNKYWPAEYLDSSIKTTNLSSMTGDGLTMAQAAGADLTGMGWTQLMPLSYIDNGQLAFGGIENAIFVSPNTGKRYINESEERDALCFSAFRNGTQMYGSNGVYFYFSGKQTYKPTYGPWADDREKRQYTTSVDKLPELFSQLNIKTDPQTVINTIREYDSAIMDGRDQDSITKTYATTTIGTVTRNPDGSYDRQSYSLENTEILFRLLAPATHHTMGGLRVDTERHVLDKNGNPIPGLFAAGEVTGGIHGGNRLGGNALTEILVAGRIAARTAGSGK